MEIDKMTKRIIAAVLLTLVIHIVFYLNLNFVYEGNLSNILKGVPLSNEQYYELLESVEPFQKIDFFKNTKALYFGYIPEATRFVFYLIYISSTIYVTRSFLKK